jgi:transaldolase
MRFFVDTADISEIHELAATGLLDGVTTNPSLIAKTGRPFSDVIAEICDTVRGPVSAEVVATRVDDMVAEGERLAAIASNVVVKVPSTWEGFLACRALSQRGIKVNVTMCFSANQGLLAAKTGATFISPFVGRLDDIDIEGMDLVRSIRTIYGNYPSLNTEILASSIRSPLHVTHAAMAGAHIATMPSSVFKKLAEHPLTEIGLAAFLADWKTTGQAII